MTDPSRAKHLPVLEENPRGIAEAALHRADRDPLDPSVTREALTYDMRRSRRKRAVRARTISMKRMTKRELRFLAAPVPDAPPRPRTRRECAGGERPCPYVSCAHHLYLDVSPKTGSIQLNFPDLEPDELTESCALDVADRGGETLEAVGDVLNLTRERVRQIENSAIRRLLTKTRAMQRLRELATGGVDREHPLARREVKEFEIEGFLADTVPPPALEGGAQ